jgi:hypothetical protein
VLCIISTSHQCFINLAIWELIDHTSRHEVCAKGVEEALSYSEVVDILVTYVLLLRRK